MLISHPKWQELLNKVHDFQLYLAGGQEPLTPFILGGDDFLLWYIRDFSFHPLLRHFPEGVLLIHLSPAILNPPLDCEEETAKKTDIPQTAKAGQHLEEQDAEFILYIRQHCLTQLGSGKNRVPTERSVQICGEDVTPNTVGQLVFREFPVPEGSLRPPVDSSHCDSPSGRSVTGGTVTTLSERSGVSGKVDYNDFGFSDSISDSESQPSALESLSSVTIQPRSTSTSRRTPVVKPSFHAALLERRLLPVALTDVSYFFSLVQREIALGKFALRVPIMVMVNDSGPESHGWDLSIGHYSSALDKKEAERLQTPEHESPSAVSDHALDITPAPVRVSQLDDATNARPSVEYPVDGEPAASADETEVNWATYSRRTYVCLYDAMLHSRSVHTVMGHQLASAIGVSRIELSSACVNEDVAKTVPSLRRQSSRRLRQVVVRVPVLPQESLLANSAKLFRDEQARVMNSDHLPITMTSANVVAWWQEALPPEKQVPIGVFLLSVLPSRIPYDWAARRLSSCPAPDTVANLTAPDDCALSLRRTFDNLMKVVGPPLATSRFDLIDTADLAVVPGESTSLDDLLRRRATTWETMVADGPLVSVHVTWPIVDPWASLLFPSFPKPDAAACALRQTEISVTMKTGEGKKSFLHWMWADLALLRNMRTLRLQLSADGIASNVDESMLDVSLHAPEELEMYTRLLNATQSQEKKGSDLDAMKLAVARRHLLRLADPGVLPTETFEFLETERRLGQGTVRRRGVSRPTGPTDDSFHDKENTTETKPSNGREHSLIEGSCMLPPVRTDVDFSDRLWYFLRRGWTLRDIYSAVQLVLDSIGNALPESGTRNQGIGAAASPLTPLGTPPVLLPPLRKNSSTKLAMLIRIVIQTAQLRRYHHHPTESHQAATEASQLHDLESEWCAIREHYRSKAACLDLVHEIGVEAVYRDAVQQIQKADPSVSYKEMERYMPTDAPVNAILSRLDRLHEIAELAVLAQKARLPWDPTRTLLRQALDTYRPTDKEDSDCARHALFVLGLNRQVSRPLLDHWIRRKTETQFILRFGKQPTTPVVEAIFSVNRGQADVKHLSQAFDLYPRDLETYLENRDLADAGDPEEISQHPVYVWRSYSYQHWPVLGQEHDDTTTRQQHTAVSSPTSPTTRNVAKILKHTIQGVSYTLQLVYDEPVL